MRIGPPQLKAGPKLGAVFSFSRPERRGTPEGRLPSLTSHPPPIASTVRMVDNVAS